MPSNPWWGKYKVVADSNISWNIGSRSILIERMDNEWVTWNICENIPTCNDILVSRNNNIPQESLDKASKSRHLQGTSNETIHVSPALADRPVVARPTIPISIVAGDSVIIYLSTPLWFNACLDEKQEPILDIPFYRPSDSWFGPSTISGEICYAKYTDALLNLETVEKRQHRAITPIHITNEDTTAINIERISVPVPLLSLYSDEDSQLWTNTISITHDTERSSLTLALGKGAPTEAINSTFVQPPRNKIEKNILIRSINSLFA